MSHSAVLMGIVNVTPDSFSDGGQFREAEQAVAHALRLVEEGADWLDVGGESTRPGSLPVSAQEEMDRVLPVIEGIRAHLPGAPISIDTQKAAVARAAVAAGAGIINDVSALGDPEMGPLVAESGADVVLMHMRGQPKTMQRQTHYEDLVGEVEAHLLRQAAVLHRLGVDRERIILDPGVGFGKAPRDNPRLIAAVPRFRSHGYRVLVGASRKRFIGDLTGVAHAADRVHGSVGAALAAVARGADIVRVHDVAATSHALTVFCAVERESVGA